jgi:hypothetical protein
MAAGDRGTAALTTGARSAADLDELFGSVNAAFERAIAEARAINGLMLLAYFNERPQRFGQGLRRPRSILITDLIDYEDALDAGLLDEREADALWNLDLLVTGQRGKGDAAVDGYVAVEISAEIDAADIERVRECAELLGRLGFDTKAAVAGFSIESGQSEAAATGGVTVILKDA